MKEESLGKVFYNVGLCDYSGVMKPTGQEMTVIEKTMCYSVQEERATTPGRAKWGGTRWVKSQREKNGQEPLVWFPREGTVEAG